VNRNVLIAGGLVAAGAFVYLALRTTSKPATQPTIAFHPTVGDAAAAPPTAGSASPEAGTRAVMTPREEREHAIKINTEMCTKEGEKINTIAGRAPTDPIVINIVSYCFRVGNLAWARCIDEATDNDTVKVCNTRFLDW
jgi:hypothetical protein